MNREQAKQWVQYVVDDTLCGRRLGDDSSAVIREKGGMFMYPSVLVGWELPDEPDPVIVAVHSYLDVMLKDEEVAEMARDFLIDSRGRWFTDDYAETLEWGAVYLPEKPSYIIR